MKRHPGFFRGAASLYLIFFTLHVKIRSENTVLRGAVLNRNFSETLRRLRTEKNLSQLQLAEMLFVDRSSIANWEAGRRIPDAVLISRIADAFDVDIDTLLRSSEDIDKKTNIIMVDDEKVILQGTIPVLEKVFPDAAITGFSRPSNALSFAANNSIQLAFLDIEMGKTSGLDLCRELIAINPRTNVVFLTAYMDYSFDAWSTGAGGFLMKPLTEEDIRRQLPMLKYPLSGA